MFKKKSTRLFSWIYTVSSILKILQYWIKSTAFNVVNIFNYFTMHSLNHSFMKQKIIAKFKKNTDKTIIWFENHFGNSKNNIFLGIPSMIPMLNAIRTEITMKIRLVIRVRNSSEISFDNFIKDFFFFQ